MSKIIIVIGLIFLILVGSAAAGIVRLTTAPTAPLRVDTNNGGRYFLYGGKTVVLLGMSGEFLPQMNWGKANAPTDLLKENCGAHFQSYGGITKQKFKSCIDRLAASNIGLNVIRLWVAMNHSPGRGLGGNNDPFLLEQPYTWEDDPATNPTVKKWNMDKFDPNYDRSLYDVVKYAQQKGVIVEVTLFNPFIVGSQAKSPWLKANHTMGLNIVSPDPCAGTSNSEFTDYLQQFVKGDKGAPFLTAANNYQFPPASQLANTNYRIDSNCQNVKARMYQVRLARPLADLLNGKYFSGDDERKQPLYNFYWELANEPDGDSATYQKSLNWHYYMAWQLREYEKSTFPASYHLIAANLAQKPLFDDVLSREPVKNYIDIVEAHYVKKGTVDPGTDASGTAASNSTDRTGMEAPDAPSGEEPTPPDGEEPIAMGGAINPDETTRGGLTVSAAPTPTPEFGAIEMIRTYNVYGGPNAALNNKVWGFNETRITGFEQDGAHQNPATPASARAEAWEFMLSGGAIYNNMGFNWANLNPTQNKNTSEWTIEDLAKLYSVIGDSSVNLKTMRRNSKWITNLPPYGKPPANSTVNIHYALMTNFTTFLYYRHNSRYSTNDNTAKYDPVIVNNGYNDKVIFKNPFDCSATFAHQWIKPKANNHPEIVYPQPPILQETAEANVSPDWTLPKNGTKELSTGMYNFDIALRITKKSGCTTVLPGMNVQAQSNSAGGGGPIGGATATASSELGEDYPASSVIDGDRTGVDWGHGGGWSDATSGEYPDWVQLNYERSQKINEVDIFTLRDNYADGAEVTEDDTFSLYGASDIELQYLDSLTQQWVTVPNGIVTGNNKAWIRITFESVLTDAIRVVVNRGSGLQAGGDDHSRIVEIETYNNPAPGGGDPTF
jgi:F5/8 type C domain